jgi:Uma2 family endonuclease
MMAIPVPTDTPAVSGPPNGQWNLEAWETLPDDGNRYEIIGGVLYVSTSPTYFHQYIVKRIYNLVGAPAEEKGLGEAVWSPLGVIMEGAEPVQPDFFFVRAENAHLLSDRRIYGVPDLIVEVISPGSRTYDEQIKRDAYEKAGVPEYALIDPEHRTLTLHSLNLDSRTYNKPIVFEGDQQVEFACVPGITFKVSDLFEGASNTKT